MKNKTIESAIVDPILMKRIIDNILDPKNPDAGKIKKEIIKNISQCIQKDDAFLTTMKGMCIENSEKVSETIIQKSLDDSREYLINAIVTTINVRCQEFFEDKKKMVSEMLKEALNKSVDEISKFTEDVMKKTEEKLETINSKTNKNCVQIEIPSEHKDEILNYVNFLSSKNK